MDIQSKTTQRHRSIVDNLQRQVILGVSQKRSSTASHTMRKYEKNFEGLRLDLSELNQILYIDTTKQIALVEPKVTMEQLVKTLLPFGFVPPVIAEFKNITVGGAINGASLESTSHAYGQFNDICIAYNVLLSDGKLVRASKTENPDLFYGISGSYGSLGQIVSVEIALVPVKPWVKVQFTRFNSVKETVQRLSQSIRSGNPDYVEGLLFDSSHGVSIEGHLAEKPDQNAFILKQKNHWEPWYYQILREKSSTFNTGEFYMPLEDYLFRYDRGAFWMGTYFLHGRLLMNFWTGIWKEGNFSELRDPGSFFRGMWGWVCNSKRLYSILHWHGEKFFAKRSIVQDFYLPENKTTEFVERTLEMTGISPLWLCPVKTCGKEQTFAPHAIEEDYVFDVGVYGFPKENQEGEFLTEQLEKMTHDMGGRKMLYSYTFFPKEEFWKIYSKKDYDDLKRKWDPTNSWRCISKKVLRTV